MVQLLHGTADAETASFCLNRRRMSRWFRPTGFLSHVAALFAGTVASQAVTLLSMPLLTRIYGPAEFAALAIFVAISSLLGSLATGHYEFATLVADSDREAAHVSFLALFLAAACVAACTPVCSFVGGFLPDLIASRRFLWGFSLSLSVSLVSVTSVFGRLHMRASRFSRVASAEFAGTAVTAATSLLAGYWLASSGWALVIALLIGRVTAACLLLRGTANRLWLHRGDLRWAHLKVAARKHWRFPAFVLPSELMARAATDSPKLLLGLFFPAREVGLFALAARVTESPVSLASASISPAFYHRAAQLRHDPRQTRRMIVRVAAGLACLIAVPAAVLMWSAVPIFRFVFGDAWTEAGAYARLLAPMLAVRFAVIPTWTALLANDRQHVVFIQSIAYLALSSVGLAIGGWLASSSIAVALYSTASAVVFTLLLACNVVFAKRPAGVPLPADNPSPAASLAA